MPGDSPQIVKLYQKSRPLRAAFSGAGAGGLGRQAEGRRPAHGGPATLQPCPPSGNGRRGGTGDTAHMGPGPLGLSHLLEKIEQSFENRTKLQAPCNRWVVSTHDNKELVKSFPFTRYRWSFSGFTWRLNSLFSPHDSPYMRPYFFDHISGTG